MAQWVKLAVQAWECQFKSQHSRGTEKSDTGELPDAPGTAGLAMQEQNKRSSLRQGGRQGPIREFVL